MSVTGSSAAPSDYYEWPSGITLQIRCRYLPRSLQREFGAFRIRSESHRPVDARIVFCRRSKEMPLSGVTQKGRYKGMPWKIMLGSSPEGETAYFFFAPLFSTFLFVRTCLIPILKKIVTEKGGFFLIGSAFSFRDTVFIFSGKPGSGKTKLLLKGLDGGGSFLGDSELIITADRKVLPVFPYVEARRNTLYGTFHWTKLSPTKKAYLWGCHLLSRVSLGAISFNLLLDFVDSKKTIRNESLKSFKRCFVIYLEPGADGVEALELQDFLRAVESYETHYQECFGEGIYTPQLRSLGLTQLEHLLSEASFKKIASLQTAHDFLKKEMAS